MTLSEIDTDVRRILAERFDIAADVAPDGLLPNYGLDSLRSIELTLLLEDRFGIAFDDAEMVFENFATVARIASMLQAKLDGVKSEGPECAA